MSQNTICKIKRFVGGDISPAITVSFDCGNLKKEDSSQVTCDVLSRKTNEDQSNQVLVVSRKNQVYSGAPNQTESICNSMLLIRNKKTGKAKLVSSSSCQLVNCTNRGATADSLLQVSEVDRRITLAEVFGSKKVKRASERYHKMKATTASDSVMLEQTIQNVNDTIMEVDNEIPSDNTIVQKLLPPCNRDATSLDEVYSVDGLLNEKELEELKSIAESYISSSQDLASDPNFYVLPFYNGLGENRSVNEVALLLYANSLINFTRLSYIELGGRDSSDKICMHSKLIGMKILKGFTEMSGNKRVRSQALTDRAYCHAMVAILLACDYKFNADWFFGCLKGCRRKTLLPLMRVVGLVQLPKKSRSAQYTHHMKLPLPPLSLTAAKSRKR